MRARPLVIFFFLCAVFSETAGAYEPGPLPALYRGARANAMGNAFVAVADDEQAIFYNPAGLAGQKKMRMNYFDLLTEASSDAIAAGRSSTTLFKDFDANSLNALMGRNVSVRGQFTPNFTMPGFGLAMIADAQAGAFLQDRSYPNLLLGYQITNGIQAGTGFSLMKQGKRQKSDLRLGFAVKALWRRGGYEALRPIDFLQVTQQGKSYVNSLSGPFGFGTGFDLGSQYLVKVNSLSTLSAGLAYTNIGTTSFSARLADPIPQSVAAGLAWKFDIPRTRSGFTLAYDFRDINRSMDWRKKSHLGAELSLPIISFQVGLNQLFLTYGTTVDLWFLSVSLLSTAEELGPQVRQYSNRSYLLRIAFKFSI